MRDLLMIGLGAVLLLAAMGKSSSPGTTVSALARVFDDSETAAACTKALIYAEVCLGAALVAGLSPRFTTGAAKALFGVFLIWTVYSIRSPNPAGCGCGLPIPRWLLIAAPILDSTAGSLLRSIVLFAASVKACVMAHARG